MSNAADALLLVNRLLSAMDIALRLSENSDKYRAVVANALAEGRDLTDAELAELRRNAQDAVDRLGD